jgi:hypothetical protein
MDYYSVLIKVDRANRPTYPPEIKKIMHPELENQAPAEYDLLSINPWLHDKQSTRRDRFIGGEELYSFLKGNNDTLLKTCLTLLDGEQIKRSNPVDFATIFSHRPLFLWASIAEFQDGLLYVPCVCDSGGWLTIFWRKLNHGFFEDCPAGRFN